MIRPEVERELYAYQATIFKELDSPVLRSGGTDDHLHLLFRLGRRACLADVVEEVKKRSSKWIKDKGDAYRDFYWQNGYGAFSIGDSGVVALKRYIDGQKEHHRQKTFQEEFRAFLIKYGVEYDERYVWE